MPLTNVCFVQYHGGPLDGHVDTVPVAREFLIESVAIPINRNVLNSLVRVPPDPVKYPASSVAVYELVRGSEPPVYEFIGSTIPEVFGLERWVA